MHANGGRTRANYSSFIHYNTPLAEMYPSHPLMESARICNCKDGAEAVGDDAAAQFPALKTSGGSQIKMEWIADDKWRRPDVVVLWLLTGVGQD